MRAEQKLNKAIKKDGVDTQSEIREELKRRYPQYFEQSAGKKQAPVKKRKTAVIFAFAAVAVCAAIVVPCAVLLPNRGSTVNNGGNESNRYCTQDDYHKENAEYTIGEYRENNNRNFLYFDWYEYGEDCSTVCYISNSDNEVLGLEENIYLPESDEFVRLSLTKANVYLSVFDVIIADCNSEYTVDNHTVKWVVNEAKSLCIFEDGGYRYFIQILPGEDENRLFDMVAELLGTK